MYIKYYGIFNWIDNKLYGFCNDYGWYNGQVYKTIDLKFLTDYLQSHRIYPSFKNAFILKISGRYFTPIYKKYGILYKLEWDKMTYYVTKYPIEHKHYKFFNNHITYIKVT